MASDELTSTKREYVRRCIGALVAGFAGSGFLFGVGTIVSNGVRHKLGVKLFPAVPVAVPLAGSVCVGLAAFVLVAVTMRPRRKSSGLVRGGSAAGGGRLWTGVADDVDSGAPGGRHAAEVEA